MARQRSRNRRAPRTQAKTYRLVLVSGKRTDIPKHLYELFLLRGFVDYALANREVHPREGLHAWRDPETDLPRFSVSNPVVAPYTIFSSWIAVYRAWLKSAPFNLTEIEQETGL